MSEEDVSSSLLSGSGAEADFADGVALSGTFTGPDYTSPVSQRSEILAVDIHLKQTARQEQDQSSRLLLLVCWPLWT